jgi:hypothetical protein
VHEGTDYARESCSRTRENHIFCHALENVRPRQRRETGFTMLRMPINDPETRIARPVVLDPAKRERERERERESARARARSWKLEARLKKTDRTRLPARPEGRKISRAEKKYVYY